MRTIAVGIHTRDSMDLSATLESLAQSSVLPEVVILPNTATLSIKTPEGLPRWTGRAAGAAAAFNRLASRSDADIVVLLEAGCRLGPRALDRLVLGLDARPEHGIAGPSTNRAWNEQGVFPRAGGSASEVQRTAQLAAQRFGQTTRALEPLHSLGDFCYAVSREVIDAIGAADEGYGDGPCWEMEYNARASRAGFKGVWVCGAYVFRPPQPRPRQAAEARLLQASKHRYQDHLCGLRLRGSEVGYEAHCLGDECEHFAPLDLIQRFRPFPANETIYAVTSEIGSAKARPGFGSDLPLVSCIMPTRNRRRFIPMALRCFERQDYPRRELIVVDDGEDDISDLIPDHPAIRYLRLCGRHTVGAKRNRACEAALGEIIVHWDDDDWYGPTRLADQVAPLIADRADITALAMRHVLTLEPFQTWRCPPKLHARLHFRDLCPGTIAFGRHLWSRRGYPNRNCAEDVAFLRGLPATSRFHRLDREDLFICLRHGENTWIMPTDPRQSPGKWQKVSIPDFLPAEDLSRYTNLAAGTPTYGPTPGAVLETGSD